MTPHHPNPEPLTLTLPAELVDALAGVAAVTRGLPVADACVQPRASRSEIGRFVP